MPHLIQPPSKRRHLLALRTQPSLTPAEQHELEMARVAYGPEWWLSDRELVWLESAQSVGAFKADHGFWPSTQSSDPEEHRLAIWLRNARTHSRQNISGWTAERAAFLDEVAPGWLGPNRAEKWEDSADTVAAFHREHGRWPSAAAADEAEARAGQWLAQARAAAKHNASYWSEERRAYLDAVAPGWEGMSDADWRRVADEVAAFRVAHGRWPHPLPATSKERRLGRWLSKQRRLAVRGGGWWSAARGKYLDAVAPGWRDSRGPSA